MSGLGIFLFGTSLRLSVTSPSCNLCLFIFFSPGCFITVSLRFSISFFPGLQSPQMCFKRIFFIPYLSAPGLPSYPSSYIPSVSASSPSLLCGKAQVEAAIWSCASRAYPSHPSLSIYGLRSGTSGMLDTAAPHCCHTCLYALAICCCWKGDLGEVWDGMMRQPQTLCYVLQKALELSFPYPSIRMLLFAKYRLCACMHPLPLPYPQVLPLLQQLIWGLAMELMNLLNEIVLIQAYISSYFNYLCEKNAVKLFNSVQTRHLVIQVTQKISPSDISEINGLLDAIPLLRTACADVLSQVWV